MFKRKPDNSSKHWQHDKPLRSLLLFHDIYFIALIVLAVASGGYGIYLWDKASKQSQRINVVIQEIYLVRGDLYRQMKELFDAFFCRKRMHLMSTTNIRHPFFCIWSVCSRLPWTRKSAMR